MAAKKFDIVDAMESKGFEIVSEYTCDSGFRYVKYSKTYQKEIEVAWYGKQTSTLTVELSFAYNKNGECWDVTASFAKGASVGPMAFKVKSYAPNKRAYNAIEYTVNYNGFEL